MSKNTKIILIAVALIFHRFLFEFIMMAIYFVLACIHGNPMSYGVEKADDAISQAVYQEFGKEGIYLIGKDQNSDSVIEYVYLIEVEKSGNLELLVQIVNDAILQEKVEDKIKILCRVNGGMMSVLCLCNYSDDKLVEADYKTLQRCDAWGCRSPSLYNEPSEYRELSGIVDFRVSGYVAKNAEEQGIDWYEYFPELERLEVDLPEE